MEKQDIKVKKSVLGRGLSSLISSPVPVSFRPVTPEPAVISAIRTADFRAEQNNVSAVAESKAGEISFLAVTAMVPNPTQPRQHFAEEELRELSDSIRTLGVLQPVLVRPNRQLAGQYEIIAGERRWRAAQRAGLQEIPAVIRTIDDRETLEIALVENVQRANLNPIEEAQAYQRLASEFQLTQQDIAERIGKDRTTVANAMRLLKLPKEILQQLHEGAITMGHARAILAIKDPAAQISLARKTIQEGLSVRALETLVSRAVVLDAGKTAPAGRGGMLKSKDPSVQSFPEILERLRNALGTKVTVKHQRSGKGRIEIDYFSESELDRVVEKILGGSAPQV